jgi:hypothetical protein
MTKAGRALVAVSDCQNRESLVQALADCGLEPIFFNPGRGPGAPGIRSARRIIL